MWGQVAIEEGIIVSAGIIPTRVGTSATQDGLYTPFEDHPHACGDKFPIVRRISKGLGSSPRVWGQGSFAVRFAVFVRIIPTRMGTSFALYNIALII